MNSSKNNGDLSRGTKGIPSETISEIDINKSSAGKITIIKRNPQYASFTNTVYVMSFVILSLITIGVVGEFNNGIITGIIGGILLVLSFYGESEMKNVEDTATKRI